MTHIRIDPHGCLSPEARKAKAERQRERRSVLLWLIGIAAGAAVLIATGIWQ